MGPRGEDPGGFARQGLTRRREGRAGRAGGPASDPGKDDWNTRKGKEGKNGV